MTTEQRLAQHVTRTIHEIAQDARKRGVKITEIELGHEDFEALRANAEGEREARLRGLQMKDQITSDGWAPQVGGRKLIYEQITVKRSAL